MRHFLLLAFLTVSFAFTSTAQIETEDRSFADEWAHFITSLNFSGGEYYSGEFVYCNGYIACWRDVGKIAIGYSSDGGKTWDKYYTLETDEEYDLKLETVRANITYGVADDFILCAESDMGRAWLFTLEGKAESLLEHMPASLRERTSVFTGREIDVHSEMPDFVLEAGKNRYISEMSGLMASLAMEENGGTEVTSCRGHISIWPEPGKLIVGYSNDQGKTLADKYVIETENSIDLNKTIEKGFLSYSVTDEFLMCAGEEGGPVYFFTLESRKDELIQHFPESLSERAIIYTGSDLSKTVVQN